MGQRPSKPKCREFSLLSRELQKYAWWEVTCNRVEGGVDKLSRAHTHVLKLSQRGESGKLIMRWRHTNRRSYCSWNGCQECVHHGECWMHLHELSTFLIRTECCVCFCSPLFADGETDTGLLGIAKLLTVNLGPGSVHLTALWSCLSEYDFPQLAMDYFQCHMWVDSIGTREGPQCKQWHGRTSGIGIWCNGKARMWTRRISQPKGWGERWRVSPCKGQRTWCPLRRENMGLLVFQGPCASLFFPLHSHHFHS